MTAAPDRLLGILLFLPVPLVLWLFTQRPLGLWPSLALGAVLMLTHRLYARPFALSRSERRCLWCGSAAQTEKLTLDEPLGRTEWSACSPQHVDCLQRLLGWAARHALFLRVGVLGTLALFLVVLPLTASQSLRGATAADATALFRIGIALTVLPLGLLAPFSRVGHEQLRVPFPVHIQALIGTWSVLWLFRLVGLVWLALGLAHLGHRLGL